MKKLDTKSMLIGLLLGCCVFLFIGSTYNYGNSKNLGDIEVNSITVKNGGFIDMYNPRGEQVVYLGATKYGDGGMMLYDSDGNMTIGLANYDGGLVLTFRKGENWAMIGSDYNGGYLGLRHGEEIYFAAMVNDNRPWIGFWDKNKFIWGQNID